LYTFCLKPFHSFPKDLHSCCPGTKPCPRLGTLGLPWSIKSNRLPAWSHWHPQFLIPPSRFRYWDSAWSISWWEILFPKISHHHYVLAFWDGLQMLHPLTTSKYWLLPLALRIRGSVHVPLGYFIRCTSLLQSSLLGACTLVIKNSIAVHVLGLAHLVAYSVLATRLWNSMAFSGWSFLQSSLTLKRLLGAASYFFLPPPMVSTLLKAMMISSM
jgi:hypothetical protein